MKGQHKDFTENFKRQAVRLGLECGQTIAGITEDSGIILRVYPSCLR